MKFWNLLLILRVSSYTASAQQTKLMQSLNCVNDYRAYTTCTWSECEDARRLLKMHLFYQDNFSLSSTQMKCSSQAAGSQRHWSCSAKLDKINAVLNNIYIFKPNKTLEVQLNVSLINNIQPPPPQKLSIRNIEGGHFQLEWEAGDGTNRSHLLDETLDFEVSYKRTWEHWEKSPSILVSNASHYLLRWDSLVLGSTYSARVRSQLRQGSGLSGHPSEWSSEIQWNTPKGDEAQPKNLRCLFNGIDQLICSWEVRQEVANSVLFSLFYQVNPGSEEKECYPVQVTKLSLNAHVPQVLQSCVITVTDRLSQYNVTVRPKEETKVMVARNHIKPHPPYNLSVEKTDNRASTLRWEAAVINKYSDISKKYQISYWKTSEPLEKKTQDVRDSSFFTFTPQFLETATRYKAKVRAKVNSDGYDGLWSEWSEEHGWETDVVWPSWSLLLLVPAMIILMAVVFCCGCKYLLNKKKKWVANIPRPPMKFLLPDYFPKIQHSSLDFSSQNTVGTEEISCTTVLERPPLVTPSESLGAKSGKVELLSAYSNMEIIQQFPLPTVDVGQFTSQAGPSPTRDLIPSAKGRLVQVFDFDGPYLHCLPESPVPDIQQNVRAAPLETGKPSVSLQYMELPPNLWPQKLPTGKENEAAASLTAVHDWEENKHPLLTEVSRGQSASGKLEQEGRGQRPQSPTTAKNPCQNGPLDYIATADLPLATEKNPSLLLPVESSKQEEFTCASMETPATQSPQTTEGLSGLELGQKGQAQPAPSRPSLEAFGDYVMTLPGSAPQEGLAYSPAEPPHDKGFFLFNPDNRSPVFLQQEGDYCFFPGTKPIKAPQSQGESVGHSLSVTKPHRKGECVGGKLQPSSHICIDARVNAYQ